MVCIKTGFPAKTMNCFGIWVPMRLPDPPATIITNFFIAENFRAKNTVFIGLKTKKADRHFHHIAQNCTLC